MSKLRNYKDLKQAADKVLQSYLMRCYTTVSKQYPPIEGMNPEEGVEHLLKLRDEGKIRISLDSVGELIECTISSIN